MVTDNESPHIYRVGPWRYLWLWLVFGPLALISFAAGLSSELAGERAPLLVGGVLWLLVPFVITLLVRMARLELSDRGVRLKQIGYRLEAPWSDIAGLRLDRGHEGFVTARPVGGKGAGLLAVAGRAIPLAGAQYYDDEQQVLLDEHRLIPIEAFVWHLRHGGLRADIARFAPHLEGDLAALDRPAGRSAHHALVRDPERPAAKPLTASQWAVLSLIPLSLALGFYLAAGSERTRALAWQAAGVIYPALFALQVGMGAATGFRRGFGLAGAGLALFATLLGLWAFGAAIGFAGNVGLDRPLVQLVAAAIPVCLTGLAGYGARNAFRRHSCLLGAALALVTGFLMLWAVAAGLDFMKVLR